MARKRRNAAKKQLESPDSPFFKLPGELRNRIYELVFAHDNEPVNVEDAFSPSSNVLADAAPPSLALLRTCRKLYHESKGYFSVPYRNYWRKEFVIDLRRVDALREYIEFVPTDWIDTYIMILDTGRDDLAEVTITRESGRWRVKERSRPPLLLTREIATHARICFSGSQVYSAWFSRNVFWNDCIEALHSFPNFWWTSKQRDRWTQKFLAASPKSASKKSTGRSSKSKKKSKPKYKRPKRPTDAQTCRRTNPKCGPFTESLRRAIKKNRMELAKGRAPLTKTELLRVLQPRMGLPPYKFPGHFYWATDEWDTYLNTNI